MSTLKIATNKLSLRTNSILKKTLKMKFRDFEIFYDNQESLEATIQEIFVDEIYAFKSSQNSPFIIDAGSHIGISTLFFKMQYPHSKIVCFEPDPRSFKLLTKNVQHNKLQNVLLINAALSKQEGTVPFYGEDEQNTFDNRGNSIIKNWGMQRETSIRQWVQSICLSSYIDQPVDFLKMDIEGAEQGVLEELGDRLHFIKALTIEIHDMQVPDRTNLQENIRTLLKNKGFKLEMIPLNLLEYLPLETAAWIQQTHPILSLLKASRF